MIRSNFDVLAGGTRRRAAGTMYKYTTAKRNALRSLLNNPAKPEANEKGDAIHCEPSYIAGWRNRGFCDEINKRTRHTGWFIDDQMSDTYRGQVWQLPTGRPKLARFVAGYVDPNSETVTLDATHGKLEIYTCPEDAARGADELARIHAESEREYQAEFREASALLDECETLRQTMRTERDELLNLTRAWRAQSSVAPMAAEIRALLTTRITETREAFREALRELIGKAQELRDHPRGGDL